MKKDPKVMIMGLDAMTWTRIDPWMTGGGLANLARLLNPGVSGRLELILVSITPPARLGRTAQAVTADEESAKVEKRLQARGYLE